MLGDGGAAGLTDLPIEAAQQAKWDLGRIKYGPVFVGNPIEQLDDELIDALNYCEEAARRGYAIAEIADDIRMICERVRALPAPRTQHPAPAAPEATL